MFKDLKFLVKYSYFDDHYRDRDPNEDLGKTVYGEDQTVKQFLSCQNRVHRWLKYAYLVPLLKVARWILGKWVVTEVSDNSWHRNIKIFDSVYEETLKDWCDLYLSQTHNRTKTGYKEKLLTWSVKHRRTLKQLILTECVKDTADMEFLNMFMYNMTLRMNDEYPCTVSHLFHGKIINDVRYFMLKDGVFGVEEVRRQREADIDTKK